MPHTQVDTLILGQGLAGSLLAWQLIHAGQRVCVIDDAHRSSSTKVAAGLINPLAGMRFNRRPQAEDWLRAGDRCYATLAQRFNRGFFHPLPMLRLFRSAQQRRFHARRLQDPASADLLSDAFGPADCPEPVHAPVGGFLQKRTGYIDLPALLAALRQWLHESGSLLETGLSYDQIETDTTGVNVAGLRAQRLVFCEGARLRFNPWFRQLPLAPDKGEILNLRVAGWHPRHIINGAYWVVPLQNGEVRLGATHEHRLLDNGATELGKRTLIAGLEALLPSAYAKRVTGHQAGIRPATRDRYPLLGRHNEQPALWVFNGFGAHGSLVIPWYAERFCAHLLHADALPPEADIRRFP